MCQAPRVVRGGVEEGNEQCLGGHDRGAGSGEDCALIAAHRPGSLPRAANQHRRRTAVPTPSPAQPSRCNTGGDVGGTQQPVSYTAGHLHLHAPALVWIGKEIVDTHQAPDAISALHEDPMRQPLPGFPSSHRARWSRNVISRTWQRPNSACGLHVSLEGPTQVMSIRRV